MRNDLDLSDQQKDAIVEIIYTAFEKKITTLELKPKSKEQGLRILKKSAKFEHGLYKHFPIPPLLGESE